MVSAAATPACSIRERTLGENVELLGGRRRIKLPASQRLDDEVCQPNHIVVQGESLTHMVVKHQRSSSN